MYVWSEAVWPPHLTLLLLVLMLSTVHVRAGLSVRLLAMMVALLEASVVVSHLVLWNLHMVSCAVESFIILFNVCLIVGAGLEVVVSSIKLNGQVDVNISFNHL